MGMGSCQRTCRCTPPLQHSHTVSLSAQRWTAGMLSAAVTLLRWHAFRRCIDLKYPLLSPALLYACLYGQQQVPSCKVLRPLRYKLTVSTVHLKQCAERIKEKCIGMSCYQLTSSFAMIVCRKRTVRCNARRVQMRARSYTCTAWLRKLIGTLCSKGFLAPWPALANPPGAQQES